MPASAPSMLSKTLLAVALVGLVSSVSTTSEAKSNGPSKAELAEAKTNKEAEYAYKIGYQFFHQGQLNKAKESLLQALQIQPKYPEAIYVLGSVYMELSDYARAADLGRQVLEANPWFTEAHNLIGFALAKSGDFQGAMREFETVKADISYPTPEVAHVNIGKVLADTNNCGEARSHFRRALEINPKMGKAWFLKGSCEEVLGEMSAALTSLEQALAFLPQIQHPQVHYRMGYICFVAGDAACATSHFDNVLLQSPSSPYAQPARDLKRQIRFK